MSLDPVKGTDLKSPCEPDRTWRANPRFSHQHPRSAESLYAPLLVVTMPWEVTIVNYAGKPPRSYYAPSRPDPLPLGDSTQVIQRVSAVLPELRWEEEQPLPPEIIAKYPVAVRMSMSRSRLKAGYACDGFTFDLYGFGEEPTMCLHCEFRGAGDPLPWLYRLCHPHQWSVVADCDGSFVEFGKNGAARWRFFRRWTKFVNARLKSPGNGSN